MREQLYTHLWGMKQWSLTDAEVVAEGEEEEEEVTLFKDRATEITLHRSGCALWWKL